MLVQGKSLTFSGKGVTLTGPRDIVEKRLAELQAKGSNARRVNFAPAESGGVSTTLLADRFLKGYRELLNGFRKAHRRGNGNLERNYLKRMKNFRQNLVPTIKVTGKPGELEKIQAELDR